jgi:hypothetical protein
MKWTYFIRHKMAAALLLGTVIGIVLLNNLSEQKNSDELNDAFASLYEDRLLAESYILTMYQDLHEIESLTKNATTTSALTMQLNPVLTDLRETITLYSKTTLTPQEETEFNAFTAHVNAVEAGLTSGRFSESHLAADHALSKLSVLSAIQVEEGARLQKDSHRIFQSSLTSSQLEMAMLVVIGLLIQALIFSTRTLQTTTKKFGMN